MNITAQYGNYFELIRAIEEHNLAVVQWLVRSPHCAINATHEDGQTPLHHACGNIFWDCLETLLQNGANPNLPDDRGKTPFHYVAAYPLTIEMIQPLLDYGANLALTDHEGHTALHVAASQGHSQIIQLLINRGARVHECDSRQRTPLHNAAFSCNAASVLALLGAGADPHAVDAASLSPRTRSRALPFKLSKSRCQCSLNRKDDPIFGSTSSGHESAAKNAPDRASDHFCTSRMRS